MAIIVEDGTGLATANSYVSLADADAYHLLRLNSAWALGTEANRNAALVRATFALDKRYTFRGTKNYSTQALAWPRTEAIDDDGFQLLGVPTALAAAACEAALLELATPGTLTPSLDRGGMVQSEKVGNLQVAYFNGAPGATNHVGVEGLLRSLIVSNKRITRG